jgi:hypothetical protein
LTVDLTLSEISSKGNWELFCEEKGWSYWACNEGGGEIRVTLTIEEAKRYGVL